MKKSILMRLCLLALVAAMVLSLFACADETVDPEITTTGTEQGTDEETTTTVGTESTTENQTTTTEATAAASSLVNSSSG